MVALLWDSFIIQVTQTIAWTDSEIFNRNLGNKLSTYRWIKTQTFAYKKCIWKCLQNDAQFVRSIMMLNIWWNYGEDQWLCGLHVNSPRNFGWSSVILSVWFGDIEWWIAQINRYFSWLLEHRNCHYCRTQHSLDIKWLIWPKWCDVLRHSHHSMLQTEKYWRRHPCKIARVTRQPWGTPFVTLIHSTCLGVWTGCI